MKGKHTGVQKRILDVNPLAFFVPCASHSLNLVVNDATLSFTGAVNYFSNIQEIYNHFLKCFSSVQIFKSFILVPIIICYSRCLLYVCVMCSPVVNWPIYILVDMLTRWCGVRSIPKVFQYGKNV